MQSCRVFTAKGARLDTQPKGSEPQHQHHPRGPFRRFVVAPATIIATILYVYFFFGEVRQKLHELEEARPQPPLVLAIQQTVGYQVQQIRNVDALSLGGTYGSDLHNHNCNWHLECTTIEPEKPFVLPKDDCWSCQTLNKPSGQTVEDRDLQAAISRLTAPKPPPPRDFIFLGPIPVPTFHTIFGTPRALAVTISRIWCAGGWAVGMFLVCTLFYILVWRLLTRKDESDGAALYTLLLLAAAPVSIPLLVQSVQWAATGIFDGISWVLCGIVLFGLYVGGLGLSLWVAVPHIYKAPHEIAEAAEIIRRV